MRDVGRLVCREATTTNKEGAETQQAEAESIEGRKGGKKLEFLLTHQNAHFGLAEQPVEYTRNGETHGGVGSADGGSQRMALVVFVLPVVTGQARGASEFQQQ